MNDIKRAREIREILLDAGWRKSGEFLCDDFDLEDESGCVHNAIDIELGMDKPATLENILEFVRKHSGILVFALLVLQTGCAATKTETGEPFYGPHNLTAMNTKISGLPK